MATVDSSTTTSKHTCVPVTEVTTTVKDASEPKMNGNTDKKEEEPIADKKAENETSTSKSEDNQNKTEIQSEEELLSAGTKLITEEKYSEAADILSNAMSIIQQKNIANTIESVKYYMAYGEALLRLVQSSNDLFGAPVRESQQKHLAEQEKEDMDVAEPELITDATEQSEPEKKETSGNSKEEQDDDDDDADLKQNPASNSKEEAEDEQEQEAAPDNAPAGGGDEPDTDTAEDREYAWESFEFARSIIEEYLNKEENKDKHNDSYYKTLAEAHGFLGELLLEDEVYEGALIEFNKAIEIQNKCKNKNVIKCRSKASNHFMACLAAQFAEKDDDAVKHCDAALSGLSERISELLTTFGCTECVEMKENDYTQIIKTAEGFMGDASKFTEEKKGSEDGKEMKALFDVMGDLMAKLEEVKETIQLKKDGKWGNTADQMEANGAAAALGAFDQKLAMDPLQALISGLTSKFGIDEEQLAAMAAEHEQDGDENKNTSNKNVSQAGVTTIGFGDVAPIKDDEEVNEIMCVKRKKKDDTEKVVVDVESKGEKEEKVEKKKLSGRKRKMEDADIDDGMEEVNGAAKKMKLNSGDAATAVANKDENEDREK